MRLFCGDNEKILSDLIHEGVKVDMVLTSPPYDDIRDYVDGFVWNFEKFKSIANLLYSILKEGCVLVWVVGDATVRGGNH